MSVTIKQIADLANVSRGTVDKVLNNRPGVKAETKEKVLRIAKEMNYHPNLLGKALVQSRTPLRIGVIVTADYNPYVQDLLQGIQKAAAEYEPFGLEIVTRMLSSIDPLQQLSMMNDLLAQNVNGLAIFPIDDPQIIARVNQLAVGNIPIVTFNSPVEQIHSLCFVGQDHYKGGKTAAALVRKVLPGPKKIGVIVSSGKLSCHQDRLRGFLDVMQGDPSHVEILDVQENQDRRDIAFSVTLEQCNAHPDLDAIYITGGGVEGVCSALDIADTQKSVHLICHDLTASSRQLLNQDKIDFVLDQDPQAQGYQIIKVLFDYCIKKITPPSVIDIPISIIVKEAL